jgi:hypothetical protein
MAARAVLLGLYVGVLGLPLCALAAPPSGVLHHWVCEAAVEAMLQSEPVATAALRQALPELEARQKVAVTTVLAVLPSMREREQPLSAKALETLSTTLTNSLAALQNVPDTQVTRQPLADLPERLDFALLLYVSHSQIGMLRPARERQGSYLSEDLVQLATEIDRDMAANLLPDNASQEQLQAVADVRQRWGYIAKQLLDYRRQATAPLTAAVQIRRIGDELRQLRGDVEGGNATTPRNSLERL